jgi:adenylate cyclase
MTPKRCTMLFSDIAGFTSMCERVPHDELSGLVCRYFETMSAIVMRHGGVIDKYIGDCIMGVWGAPFGIGNQEARATLCAALMELEARSADLGGAFDAAGEQLAIRVGVATGTVLAGNMGSADRMNYTVIGDEVNLAARLEALNKQFGTRVMVSESTARELPPGVFALRQLHRIQVVGKEVPVAVFEVLGLREGALTADALQLMRREDDAQGSTNRNSDADSSDGMSNASDVRTDRDDKEFQPMARLLGEASHFGVDKRIMLACDGGAALRLRTSRPRGSPRSRCRLPAS